jgi:ribosomal protein S15P/S13E
MKLVKPRDLAQRSLGLVASAVSYLQASKAGVAPSPLLLLIRKINQIAEHILEQPSPVASPAQRRTLQLLASQLRGMSSRIIITKDRGAPNSVESELAELVRRTLELIDRVCTEPPTLEPGNVIDVDVLES